MESLSRKLLLFKIAGAVSNVGSEAGPGRVHRVIHDVEDTSVAGHESQVASADESSLVSLCNVLTSFLLSTSFLSSKDCRLSAWL